jgi:hypothetical protein
MARSDCGILFCVADVGGVVGVMRKDIFVDIKLFLGKGCLITFIF